MPDFFSTFLVTSTGPVSISAGSEPILANALILARGFSPARWPASRVADQHRGGAVDDAGGIAGVMDVIDVFDVRMRLDGDRIEAAEFAHLHERRLQRGERLHGRARTHVLVLGQDGQPVDVLDRHDRAIEAALVPRRRRALLALHRIGVDVVARKSVFGRDQVGGNALRQEIMRDRDRRIDRPGAARGADADPAHGFDAAADRHVLLPGHDLRRRRNSPRRDPRRRSD